MMGVRYTPTQNGFELEFDSKLKAEDFLEPSSFNKNMPSMSKK